MNRMGGEYLGLTMKYLFGQETCTFDVGCCNTPIAAHSKERSIPRSAAPDVTVCSAGWAGHVRPTWQIKSIIHRHEYYQFLALDKVYNCIR